MDNIDFWIILLLPTGVTSLQYGRDKSNDFIATEPCKVIGESMVGMFSESFCPNWVESLSVNYKGRVLFDKVVHDIESQTQQKYCFSLLYLSCETFAMLMINL